MKKLINILLITSILFSTLGHIFVFNYQQRSIQLEMLKAINNHEDMPSELIATLIIPKNKLNAANGFRWTESNEFNYYGNMYDVITQYDVGNAIKFICYHDVNETMLINNYVQHNNENDLKHPPIKRFFKLHQPDIFYNYTDEISQEQFLTIIHFDNYCRKLLFTDKLPITPPPEFVVS